jgi:hypothetical protein
MPSEASLDRSVPCAPSRRRAKVNRQAASRLPPNPG